MKNNGVKWFRWPHTKSVSFRTFLLRYSSILITYYIVYQHRIVVVVLVLSLLAAPRIIFWFGVCFTRLEFRARARPRRPTPTPLRNIRVQSVNLLRVGACAPDFLRQTETKNARNTIAHARKYVYLFFSVVVEKRVCQR